MNNEESTLSKGSPELPPMSIRDESLARFGNALKLCDELVRLNAAATIAEQIESRISNGGDIEDPAPFQWEAAADAIRPHVRAEFRAGYALWTIDQARYEMIKAIGNELRASGITPAGMADPDSEDGSIQAIQANDATED